MAQAAIGLNSNGAQKAAILMLALGAENAGRLFTMMHEDEIRLISSAMAQLGAVPAEAVENLCNDFVHNFGASGGILGSYENTESRLLKALPKERVARSWRKSAVRPAARCGTSLAT